MADMLADFCELYNAALQQRIEAWRRQGITLSFFTQCSEVKAIRASDARFMRLSFIKGLSGMERAFSR